MELVPTCTFPITLCALGWVGHFCDEAAYKDWVSGAWVVHLPLEEGQGVGWEV